MKVLSTSVVIVTSDLEAAIKRHEALTREVVRQRFELPDRVVFEFVEPHLEE